MRKDRSVKVVLGLLALSGLLLPLWVVSFNAPMFGRTWLTITIYGSGSVEGPIQQVNIANHYVGLREIRPEEMPELQFLPSIFIVAAAAMLLSAWRLPLRVTALIYLALLIGLPAYLQWWLYGFGHNLTPGAAIRIEPFVPYVIGPYQIANFKILTYFHAGYWVLALVLLGAYLAERRWGGLGGG